MKEEKMPLIMKYNYSFIKTCVAMKIFTDKTFFFGGGGFTPYNHITASKENWFITGGGGGEQRSQ